MHRRVVFAYAFVMLFLMIAAFGTATAALGENTYTEVVGRQSSYKLTVAVSRGTIYDRDMEPLTNASEKYIAAVIPDVESIARLNSITEDSQRDVIKNALENGKPFLISVNSPVSTEGISTFTVAKRYSEPQPAANIIGHLKNGDTGVSGIERSCNGLLSNASGKIEVTFAVDAVGRAISGGTQYVENTYMRDDSGIQLTLDKEIQMLLEDACGEIWNGAAVVLDRYTGHILAIASFPALNPARLEESVNDPNQPFVNRALSVYSPGSVFKLVVSAAALEAGLDFRETYECTGSLSVDGKVFPCYGGIAHGEVNMHTALRQSCNGYYIQLLQKVGTDHAAALCSALSLDKQLTLMDELESEAGNIPTPEEIENPRAAANFSFGQGDIRVTPLHIAAMVNTIANDGEYLEPVLYLGKVNENKEANILPAAAGKKVMEKTTAHRLQVYMESTARFGTAKIGAPENCASGIKTGTAESGRVDENGKEVFNYWYAGYICDAKENAAYTIVIMEESSGESKVPAAFKKFSESLVDFI